MLSVWTVINTSNLPGAMECMTLVQIPTMAAGWRSIPASRSKLRIIQDYYGYIGYHGLWMPTEAMWQTIALYKNGFLQSDRNQLYCTLLGRKATKYTKNTITLGSIKNIPLNWWDNSAGFEKRVFWNGSNFKGC